MNSGSKCVDCVYRDVCSGSKIANVVECSDYRKEGAEEKKEGNG